MLQILRTILGMRSAPELPNQERTERRERLREALEPTRQLLNYAQFERAGTGQTDLTPLQREIIQLRHALNFANTTMWAMHRVPPRAIYLGP